MIEEFRNLYYEKNLKLSELLNRLPKYDDKHVFDFHVIQIAIEMSFNENILDIKV